MAMGCALRSLETVLALLTDRSVMSLVAMNELGSKLQNLFAYGATVWDNITFQFYEAGLLLGLALLLGLC